MKILFPLIVAAITVGIPSANALKSKRLTCADLPSVMTIGDTEIRAQCDLTQIRCKAMDLLRKRPVEDTFRQEAEPVLQSELDRVLTICEIAVRHAAPDYLDKR